MQRKRKSRPYKAEPRELNLASLIEQFGSEDHCHEYIEKLRWPDGIRCPRCESDRISRIRERRQFDCDACRYQFSVRVGTIFHDSKLPLWKWFLAAYIMSESKKGVSANQLKRMLSVSYKTAWYLCHRIRAAMKDEASEQLKGIVEVDETFVGGKDKGAYKEGRGQSRKTIVMGAVERKAGGRVRLSVVPNRKKKAVHAFVSRNVCDQAEEIHTDELKSYDGIGDHDTEHKVINKRADGWVVADVHTNSCEGVWSLFKRSIVGSYHKLSAKHLPAYLDEMAFRFNNRENKYIFRETIKRLVEAERVEYKALTA